MAERTRKYYSPELKIKIVKLYLRGKPARALAKEYGVSSEGLIKTWVRKYINEGTESLMPKSKGGC